MSSPETEYVLSTCYGKSVTSGRRVSGFVVCLLEGTCTLRLPIFIECNEIPNNRSEIPSKTAAHAYSHLCDIEDSIPELDETAKIELLIGRDLISAHHVLDQRVGGYGLPFGQKLPLRWVIIGDVCLFKAHNLKSLMFIILRFYQMDITHFLYLVSMSFP